MLAQALKRSRIARLLVNLRVTVVCLFLLFILTLLGTIHQVEYGLYDAQKTYFESFGFLLGGFLPFPGAQLVLWILFVNLVGATIFRFVYKWNRVGILIIHLGFFVLFFGMFFTHNFATESFLQLTEGEGRNVTEDYYDWELALWREGEDARRVTALDTRLIESGQRIGLPGYDAVVTVESYERNVDAYLRPPGAEVTYLNSSGIGLLEPARPARDPEENLPGGRFIIEMPSGERVPVLLFGGDLEPAVFVVDGTRYAVGLRRKRYVMPVVVRLDDFRAEFYPESDTPESFESDVTVSTASGRLPVRISMNRPYRHRGFTLYQASYGSNAAGDEFSTFAVVENRGRVVPYVATFIIGLGLIVHFILTLAKPHKRRRVSREAS